MKLLLAFGFGVSLTLAIVLIFWLGSPYWIFTATLMVCPSWIAPFTIGYLMGSRRETKQPIPSKPPLATPPAIVRLQEKK